MLMPFHIPSLLHADLSQLSSFLVGNSTAFGGGLSSPELTSSSNGSSPESSAGATATSASVKLKDNHQPIKHSKISAPAGTDKRKQDDNNKTVAHKDRRGSDGEAGPTGHTHDQVGSEEEGQ